MRYFTNTLKYFIKIFTSRLASLMAGANWLMMENPNYFKPTQPEMKYVRNDAGPYIIAIVITLIIVSILLTINYILRRKK